VHLIGIPGVRLAHTMMMFALWAFVIVHVYLAVRADSLERHGGISSMINGGVWLRRGAKPVDAPEIG
jgi:Ni,Fe-hydrogenase I cytochrome b subunit